MITANNPIEIEIERIKESKISGVDFNNLPFGKVFSDHCFEMEYRDGVWSNARIKPFGKIEISPAASALHYGQSIFEGMKAYRRENGELVMFRPEANFNRMNLSAERMCMPHLNKELFFEGLKQLVQIDQDWIPSGEKSSLYIRPLMFATDDFIGVRPSDTYKFIIFTCPVSGYYSNPVKVRIETVYSRACEGGVGRAKAAGNYAAALFPARRAQKDGYDQLVWTDAKEHKFIEESGTMNIMFVIDNVLYTPSLSGSILPGITRDSVLRLARDWGWEVEETNVAVDFVINALKRGELQEAFGVGTAATIAHIDIIGYNGTDYKIPPIENREFSNKVSSWLHDLRMGKIEDEYHWMKII
ncbi:MAG TPA: branched-chain amino acid aminotransferase [Luteibaculaceae bacterium]|nr:branched-chain amino acid aminotransferase [Luteibaculaceae bacterium]